jgi:hypothetical protein
LFYGPGFIWANRQDKYVVFIKGRKKKEEESLGLRILQALLRVSPPSDSGVHSSSSPYRVRSLLTTPPPEIGDAGDAIPSTYSPPPKHPSPQIPRVPDCREARNPNLHE